MIDNDTIQALKTIVAEMGYENVCHQPHAFAGAILDMCNANDVKLLTAVLRAHFGGKLMSYFCDGNSDAETWMRQKAFLIDESGMSDENAESVLEMLWQAMGWQRPQPTKPEPEPVNEIIPNVPPGTDEVSVDMSRKDSSADEAVASKSEAGNGSQRQAYDSESHGSELRAGSTNSPIPLQMYRLKNNVKTDKSLSVGSENNPQIVSLSPSEARTGKIVTNGKHAFRVPAWCIHGEWLIGWVDRTAFYFQISVDASAGFMILGICLILSFIGTVCLDGEPYESICTALLWIGGAALCLLTWIPQAIYNYKAKKQRHL